MKLTILGSGGFQTIPRPTCQCSICKIARKKGVPYSRNGPSMFVHDANVLIDTPKDIIQSINREDIKKIETILFTHWHPDHTEGMRLMEEITTDWSSKPPYTLKNQHKPISVICPKELFVQLHNIHSGTAKPYFSWYEYNDFIKEKNLPFSKSEIIKGISFSPILINKNERLTTIAWLIQEKSHSVLYLPCDVKPFNIQEKYLKNLDVFIVNSPWFESKNGLKKVDKAHPLREELFSMDELINLIEKHNIKKTVIVHIEEMWRLSYEDFKLMEKKYKKYNIQFAYDGMKISV
ncbi:MAG: MBL fold metallo-hydrolase [Candidatus Woesearchaeota archaeon]